MGVGDPWFRPFGCPKLIKEIKNSEFLDACLIVKRPCDEKVVYNNTCKDFPSAAIINYWHLGYAIIYALIKIKLNILGKF